MATKVFLASPETAVESVVEGVGAAIQSSFCVAITVEMATNKITEGSTTRMIQKAEVVKSLLNLIQFIERDPNSDFG